MQHTAMPVVDIAILSLILIGIIGRIETGAGHRTDHVEAFCHTEIAEASSVSGLPRAHRKINTGRLSCMKALQDVALLKRGSMKRSPRALRRAGDCEIA